MSEQPLDDLEAETSFLPDAPPPPAPVDPLARLARLEQMLAAQAAQIAESDARHARELADQEAKNEQLAAQLRDALARPQKLVSPGEFVGREGAPDSPVADHYRLVLANGDVMPSVHPGISHVAIGDELIPVIRVYHSAAVQRAQHDQAA